MFRFVSGPHASQYFYGHIDVKLALCRFIGELLIRMPLSSNLNHVPKTFYLDEIIAKPFDGAAYMDRGAVLGDESEVETYGGLLLLEFGQVFKALYIDLRDAKQR